MALSTLKNSVVIFEYLACKDLFNFEKSQYCFRKMSKSKGKIAFCFACLAYKGLSTLQKIALFF